MNKINENIRYHYLSLTAWLKIKWRMNILIFIVPYFGALPAMKYEANGGRRHRDARFGPGERDGPAYVAGRRYTADYSPGTRIDIMASGLPYNRARVRLLSPGRETFTFVGPRRCGRSTPAETVAICYCR